MMMIKMNNEMSLPKPNTGAKKISIRGSPHPIIIQIWWFFIVMYFDMLVSSKKPAYSKG